MRLRGATGRDFNRIKELFDQYEFKFEPRHLSSIVVIENESGVIAVGTLSTVLEGAFVVDANLSKKEKVVALSNLMSQSEVEARAAGYDNFHAFATNESIRRILKRKFKFQPARALEVLIRWVDGKS